MPLLCRPAIYYRDEPLVSWRAPSFLPHPHGAIEQYKHSIAASCSAEFPPASCTCFLGFVIQGKRRDDSTLHVCLSCWWNIIKYRKSCRESSKEVDHWIENSPWIHSVHSWEIWFLKKDALRIQGNRREDKAMTFHWCEQNSRCESLDAMAITSTKDAISQEPPIHSSCERNLLKPYLIQSPQ